MTFVATINNTPILFDIYIDQIKYGSYNLLYELNENDDMGCDAQHTDYYLNMKKRIIFFKKPVKVKEIKIVFKNVACGTKYNDLCVSELSFIIQNKPNPYIKSNMRSFLINLRDKNFLKIKI